MRQVLRPYMLAFVFAMAVPASAALRFVDFETPPTSQSFQPRTSDDLTAFDGEVRFSAGWHAAPLINGWTTTDTYFNFQGNQIEIFFRVPVKNISFSMYGFYNESRGSVARVKYSSLAFDPAPPGILKPDPILYFAPDKGPVTVNVPVTNIRYMTIYFGGQPFCIDDFFYETTDADQFTAFARFKTPGGLPSESGRPAVSDMNVNIPLGTLFTVGMEKKQGFLDPVLPVTSTYSVGSKSVETYKYSFGKRLFSKSPVVDVGSTASSEERAFLAVHLGTVAVVMTPVSIQGPTVTLNITIVRPSALGTAENDWDKAIIDAAHERGIPPQMIKGQVAQESDNGTTFTADPFRYEPCGIDAGEVTGGTGKINKSPFSLYALEGARGTTLPDRSIAPRNRYYIVDGYDASGKPNHRRSLTTADTGVTAKQIWDANDKWPPGSTHGINWSSVQCTVLKKYLNAGGTLDTFSTNVLDFMAQTPTASSYGVMQVLYTTAIDLGWSVVPDPSNPQSTSQEPYYLIDYPQNLALQGGGSIAVGTHYDVTHFPSKTTAFTDIQAVESIFGPAFQKYNKFMPGYGAGVIAHSHDYVPLQTGLVFP